MQDPNTAPAACADARPDQTDPDIPTEDLEHEGRRYRIPAVLKRLILGARDAPPPTPAPSADPAPSDPQPPSPSPAPDDSAARHAETGRILARDIEGWSTDLAAQLIGYAQTHGVSVDDLRDADARVWKVLHRAWLGDQLLERQVAAMNASRQAQQSRPAVNVSSGAVRADDTRLTDDAPIADWMKRRAKDVKRDA